MPNRPLVSVILPCYNAERFLPEALDSIINQTYQNLEILCLNDGSTDKTPEILENYAKKDHRIRVVHNETNLKLIRSLNKGIELAKGEYIARMDADDISLPERIETELNYLQVNSGIDIVSCGIQLIDEQGKLLRKRVRVNYNSVATFYASFFYTPIGHAPLLGKTEVFKKHKYSLEPQALHTEDSELWGRLLLAGYKLNNINRVLYKVRENTNSVSRLFTANQDENYVLSCAFRYHKYYSAELNTRAVALLVNRIPDNIVTREFISGIKTLNKFTNFFIKREQVTEKLVLKEIQTVYYAHLFDICYQTLNKPKVAKWVVLKMFFVNLRMFCFKDVRSFIFNKLGL